jgi:sulfur-oxidizing protein SoxY
MISGILLFALDAGYAAAEEQYDASVWTDNLKPTYFKDAKIIEDKTIIELVTPYRAEDAALMPISVNAKIPQTAERYIKTLYMFVDKNPQPLVGIFHFTPAMRKADLATRIRINQYTNVRAVAVLNNGEHHMTANFVKAQGGCSAPLAADLKAAMQRIGQMRFRLIGEPKDKEPALANFIVSHPNITGMQMDQITRHVTPEHYVKSIAFTYQDQPLMTAEVGFSLSADPSLRFFFDHAGGGKLAAKVVDSKGQEWSQQFEVGTGKSAESESATSAVH